MSHHPLAQLVEPGTRLTAQRQLMWNVLHQTGDALTAEQIRVRLASRLPGVNLPTIYRNLQFLRAAGLIQELHLGEGPVRFEAALEGERHPHLVCRSCGAIEHLDPDDLAEAAGSAATAHGFGERDVEVVIYATCSDCERRPTIAAVASAP